MNTKINLDEILYSHENFAKEIKEGMGAKKQAKMLKHEDVFFINILLKEYVQYKDSDDDKYLNHLKFMLRKEVDMSDIVKTQTEPEIEVVRQ